MAEQQLEVEAREDFLRGYDQRLSRLFILLLALAIAVPLITGLISQNFDATLLSLAAMLTAILFFFGLVAWVRIGNYGIIRTTRMFHFTFVVAIIAASLFTASAFLQNGDPVYLGILGVGGEVDLYHNVAGSLLVFVAILFSLFGWQLSILCQGFGIVGSPACWCADICQGF